jgi:hypothetical protein
MLGGIALGTVATRASNQVVPRILQIGTTLVDRCGENFDGGVLPDIPGMML